MCKTQICVFFSFLISPIACHLCIVDTVANTVQSTVDTTKNVASSAIEKGSSVVGSAKGINFNYFMVFTWIPLT